MARQSLAIGNTGAELVSRFNSNFTEVYSNSQRTYNVETYGAVHDGITDDTVAIQAAINACWDAGGGVVYFPRGVYIIGGALKDSLETANPNSQLYIPPYDTFNEFISIHFLGETMPPDAYNFRNGHGNANQDHVILKSTIDVPAANTALPAVIGGKNGAIDGLQSGCNYTRVLFENITIIVHFNEERGATLCGVNAAYLPMAYFRNVACGVDVADIETAITPESHVFGVIGGRVNGEINTLWENIVVTGFYVGVAAGEGVTVINPRSFNCVIGYMVLRNYYASTVIGGVFQWCKYPIAAQSGTIAGIEAGTCPVIFIGTSIEVNNNLFFYDFEDYILDTSNNIIGEISYNLGGANVGGYISKSNGGLNLLGRNIITNSIFHWTTLTRPTVVGHGTMGFNETTSKVEAWDGTQWNDLY